MPFPVFFGFLVCLRPFAKYFPLDLSGTFSVVILLLYYNFLYVLFVPQGFFSFHDYSLACTAASIYSLLHGLLIGTSTVSYLFQRS